MKSLWGPLYVGWHCIGGMRFLEPQQYTSVRPRFNVVSLSRRLKYITVSSIKHVFHTCIMNAFKLYRSSFTCTTQFEGKSICTANQIACYRCPQVLFYNEYVKQWSPAFGERNTSGMLLLGYLMIGF